MAAESDRLAWIDPTRGVRQSSFDHAGLVASVARTARNQLRRTRVRVRTTYHTTELAGWLPPCWPKTMQGLAVYGCVITGISH